MNDQEQLPQRSEEALIMVYRDKQFCSESFRCGSKDCQWWVDFEVDTEGEALSLAKRRKDGCGWSPVGKLQLQVEDGDD